MMRFMNRFFLIAFLLGLTLTIVFSDRIIVEGTPLKASSSFTLQDINLGFPIGQTFLNWYDLQSGHHGSQDYFGAYMTLPVSDTLYLALGSDLPANDPGDGSYFASLNGSILTGIAKPDEQGLHEMIYDGSLIHIAGTDPDPDDHTAGNHYIYDPQTNQFTKYRDPTHGLVDVYHTWGLWKSTSTLYAAVGSHDGSDPTTCNFSVNCFGQIFSSSNNGKSWNKLSNLGGYRAYDVFGYNNALYTISNDTIEGALTMRKSIDGGYNWSEINSLSANLRRVHLIEFNNQLISVSFDRQKLYGLNNYDQATSYPLPNGYLAGITYPITGTSYTDYNILAVAKGYLYIVAENPSTLETAILRTNDLINWEGVVHTSERMISLAYWPYWDWLVVATPGSQASLKSIDLYGSPTAVTINSFSQSTLSYKWILAGLFLGLAGIVSGLRRVFHL